MNKKTICKAWAVLYVLSAALGFASPEGGFGKTLLILLGLAFFAPPFYLVGKAKQEENGKTLKAVRIISICSLALTLVFLVLNFVSVYASADVGFWLYVILVLVSAPMTCLQYWAVSLFLWACLLFFTVIARKKEE